VTTVTLDSHRIEVAKKGFTTRRVDPDAIAVATPLEHARVGDLVLAQVRQLGHHKGLQLRTGRRSDLYVGQEVIVCVGHRYAPDQFEAEGVIDGEDCHLVAAGGVAGRVLHQHGRITAPTTLTPLALLGDRTGGVINIRDFAMPAAQVRQRPTTIAVIGTSMNAGKTTTAACLVRGLVAAGIRTGACKLTGTGAFADVWAMVDAGADLVYDFTDAGHPSTYKLECTALEEITRTLIGHLGAAGIPMVVAEVADGILQSETRQLLRAPSFRALVDGIVFAAADAVSAVGGVQILQDLGHRVVAIGGLISNSPLASREAAEATGLPVLSREQFMDPETAGDLIAPSPVALSA